MASFGHHTQHGDRSGGIDTERPEPLCDVSLTMRSRLDHVEHLTGEALLDRVHRLQLGHLEAQVAAGLLERVDLTLREVAVGPEAHERRVDVADGSDQEQRGSGLPEIELQGWWADGQRVGHLSQLRGIELGSCQCELAPGPVHDGHGQVVVATYDVEDTARAAAARDGRGERAGAPDRAGQVAHPTLREDGGGRPGHGRERDRRRDLGERQPRPTARLDQRGGGGRRLLPQAVDDARSLSAHHGVDERPASVASDHTPLVRTSSPERR